MSIVAKDFIGNILQVGDVVAHAACLGHAAVLSRCTIVEIADRGNGPFLRVDRELRDDDYRRTTDRDVDRVPIRKLDAVVLIERKA